MSGTVLGTHKRSARQLGITFGEYERHIDANEAWCWECKRWRPVGLFRRRGKDSPYLHSHCADCHRQYMKLHTRRRRAARKAAAS